MRVGEFRASYEVDWMLAAFGFERICELGTDGGGTDGGLDEYPDE